MFRAQVLTLVGLRREVATVAIFPDGKRVVGGGWDINAMVWNAVNGAQVIFFFKMVVYLSQL